MSNNSYDNNQYKGKNPIFPLPDNQHNNPNEYKGKGPCTNFSNNTYDKNDHKGKSPYTNEPNNTAYDKNDHKGKNPFPTLPNNSYDNPNEYKGKGPSTTSPRNPQHFAICDYCYQQTDKYQIYSIPKTNPEDENCSQPPPLKTEALNENASELDKQKNESNPLYCFVSSNQCRIKTEGFIETRKSPKK